MFWMGLKETPVKSITLKLLLSTKMGAGLRTIVTVVLLVAIVTFKALVNVAGVRIG